MWVLKLEKIRFLSSLSMSMKQNKGLYLLEMNLIKIIGNSSSYYLIRHLIKVVQFLKNTLN